MLLRSMNERAGCRVGLCYMCVLIEFLCRCTLSLSLSLSKLNLDDVFNLNFTPSSVSAFYQSCES